MYCHVDYIKDKIENIRLGESKKFCQRNKLIIGLLVK
jgi:hypothetical protein